MPRLLLNCYDDHHDMTETYFETLVSLFVSPHLIKGEEKIWYVTAINVQQSMYNKTLLISIDLFNHKMSV